MYKVASFQESFEFVYTGILSPFVILGHGQLGMGPLRDRTASQHQGEWAESEVKKPGGQSKSGICKQAKSVSQGIKQRTRSKSKPGQETGRPSREQSQGASWREWQSSLVSGCPDTSCSGSGVCMWEVEHQLTLASHAGDMEYVEG